jgi:hypothetical protein
MNSTFETKSINEQWKELKKNGDEAMLNFLSKTKNHSSKVHGKETIEKMYQLEADFIAEMIRFMQNIMNLQEK